MSVRPRIRRAVADLGDCAPPAWSASVPVAWKQRETAPRWRGDRSEVTFVEGQQPPRPKTVSKNHHRKICQPKIKVGVLLIQPCHGAVLISRQPLDQEPARRHVAQEGPGRCGAPAAPDEIVHFRRHWCRDNQVSAFCTQHITDGGVEPVTGIPEGDQWRSVNDQGHAPNPASSSSSGTSATEDPSPAHAPSSAKSRGAVCARSYADSAARTISAWVRPSSAARRRSRSTSESSR